MTSITGTVVFATCGIGADVTLRLDSGEVKTLPIHQRDFDRVGKLFGKRVKWTHEIGHMPKIRGG